MAITATSSESGAYMLPGEETTLAFTTTTSATTARWMLTSVPDESALTEDEYLTDAAGEYVDTFTPDVPGAYSVRGDLYWKRVGVGQYEGDPAGGTRETYQESQTATIYVGDVLDLPIVTQLGHGVTVRLGIFNATCRTAVFALPLTDASRVAALDATAVASLATCVGVAVTALDDALTVSVPNLRTAFGGHRVESVHGGGSDTVNVMTREAPYSTVESVETYNELYDKVVAHMRTGSWHNADDTKNLPLCGKAKSVGQAVVGCAELRFRCYDRHRQQTSSPASHTGSDGTNVITSAKPLAATVRDYLDALLVSTAPTGEQSGAVVAINVLGFSRAA